MEILKKVMDRAKELNIKFNADKIQYKVTKVKYMGHVISEEGVQPDTENVKAIVNMPAPEDKKGLQRVLGMTKYLSQYIRNEAVLTAPLRQLLRKDSEWLWMPEHDAALDSLKKALTEAPVLRFFDPNQQIVLQAEASKDRLAACLLQQERPVAYASRALTDAERNYSMRRSRRSCWRWFLLHVNSISMFLEHL